MKNSYNNGRPIGLAPITTCILLAPSLGVSQMVTRHWPDTTTARKYLQDHLNANLLVSYMAWDDRTNNPVIAELDERTHTTCELR